MYGYGYQQQPQDASHQLVDRILAAEYELGIQQNTYAGQRMAGQAFRMFVANFLYWLRQP